MRVRLVRRREEGLIFLGIIVVIMALGLGGCAVFEILKKGKEIEEKRHQKETNCVPEFVFDPVPPVEPGLPITEEVLADGNWVTVQGGTVIATNSHTDVKKLKDESGY